jgi:hypothetical protein
MVRVIILYEIIRLLGDQKDRVQQIDVASFGF